MLRRLGTVVCAAAGAGLVQDVAGQPAEAEGGVGPEERAPELTVDVRSSLAFETDLESIGEYEVARFGTSLAYRIPVWDRSALSLGLDVERSEYDFTGAAGLAPGGDPIGGATSVAVGATLFHPIDEEFSFLGGLSYSWSPEDGAEVGDSGALNGFAAVGWRVSSDLTLTLGAGASDRLEQSVRVFPFVGVEWRLADNLRLSSTEAGRVLAGGQTLGLGLVYESTEALSVVIGAAFNGHEFRLDEDGPIPDGVLSDSRVVAGLGVSWEPTEAVTAQLGVGAVVWSNIETRDAGGVKISDEDGDPTPFLSAQVTIAF